MAGAAWAASLRAVSTADVGDGWDDLSWQQAAAAQLVRGDLVVDQKHGVIALVKPELPSVFITPDDGVFSKNLNNIEQVRARKGPIIAVTTESGAARLKGIVDDTIIVPDGDEIVMPVLTVIPLQLFAYHLAVALGRDVDKPRNLAKSVTVE